jgi:RimJ/RimL family protein N-acetyltransferase
MRHARLGCASVRECHPTARWAVTEAPLARVEALVGPDNIASQRVLEKAGFRREGHLRSYLVFDRQRADALIYSLLRSDLA